jgi:flagellar biosynthesis anti-sigma factor FlgM
MRISRRNQVGNVGPVGPASAGAPKVNRADAIDRAIPGGGDIDVSISGKAAEVQQAQAAIQALPETRVELVSAIQQEVGSGRYQRDSKVIAKRMINEALRESLKKKRHS